MGGQAHEDGEGKRARDDEESSLSVDELLSAYCSRALEVCIKSTKSKLFFQRCVNLVVSEEWMEYELDLSYNDLTNRLYNVMSQYPSGLKQT